MLHRLEALEEVAAVALLGGLVDTDVAHDHEVLAQFGDALCQALHTQLDHCFALGHAAVDVQVSEQGSRLGRQGFHHGDGDLRADEGGDLLGRGLGVHGIP
ncbi:hypothetical protein D3C87_2005380 [compost metagenome]